MIWGFVLEPGREYTRTSEEEVHLSLAAIESRSEFGKAGSYSQLMLKTETSEQLLCTLVHGTIFQQCLDLKLMPGEKVTFTVQGSCGVYVTGYSYRSPLEPASDESSVGHEDTAGDDGIMYDGDVQVRSEAEDNDYFKGVSGDEEMTDASLYGGAVNEKEQGITPDHQFHTSEPTFDRPSKNLAAHQMQQDSPLQEDDVAILSQEKIEGHGVETDMPSSEISREEFGGEDRRDIPGPSRETGGVQESTPSITSEVIRDENGGNVHHPEGEITGQSSANAWSSEIPARQHTSNVASKKASLVSTVDRLKQSDQQGQRSKSGASGKMLVSSSQLSPGLKQVPPDDRYICPLCSEVFPAKDALLAHENKHAQEGKMFSCRYCHMVFMQKGNRNIHERIHSAMRHNFRAAYKGGGGDPAEKHQPAQPSSSSEETLKEVSSVPKQNSSTKTVVNSSNREGAAENFKSASLRKAKSETNSLIRPHPYPHYSGLGLRAQQAMEQKNYKCQYCQKPFKRNYDRNRHERIHTGQKPYGCSFCDQAFSRREHCKKHEFTHFRSRLKDESTE